MKRYIQYLVTVEIHADSIENVGVAAMVAGLQLGNTRGFLGNVEHVANAPRYAAIRCEPTGGDTDGSADIGGVEVNDEDQAE